MIAVEVSTALACRRFVGIWRRYTKARMQMEVWMHKVNLFRVKGDQTYIRRAHRCWVVRATELRIKGAKLKLAMGLWTRTGTGPALKAWIGFTQTRRRHRLALALAIMKWMPADCSANLQAGNSRSYSAAKRKVVEALREYQLRTVFGVFLQTYGRGLGGKANLQRVPVFRDYANAVVGKSRRRLLRSPRSWLVEYEQAGVLPLEMSQSSQQLSASFKRFEIPPRPRTAGPAPVLYEDEEEEVDVPLTSGIHYPKIDWNALVCSHCERRRLLHCLDMWVARVDMWKTLALQIEMSGVHMYIRRPFAKWKEKWSLQTRLCNAYERTQEQQRAHALRKQLKHWQRQYHLSAVVGFLGAQRIDRLRARGLATWARYTERAREKRMKLHAANLLRGKRLWMNALVQWQHSVAIQIVYAGKLAQALEFSRAIELPRYWRHYVFVVHERVTRRKKLLGALMRNDMGCKLGTLTAWRAQTEEAIDLRTKKAFAANFFLRQRFQAWVVWLESRRLKGLKLTRAILYWVRHRFLLLCYRVPVRCRPLYVDRVLSVVRHKQLKFHVHLDMQCRHQKPSVHI